MAIGDEDLFFEDADLVADAAAAQPLDLGASPSQALPPSASPPPSFSSSPAPSAAGVPSIEDLAADLEPEVDVEVETDSAPDPSAVTTAISTSPFAKPRTSAASDAAAPRAPKFMDGAQAVTAVTVAPDLRRLESKPPAPPPPDATLALGDAFPDDAPFDNADDAPTVSAQLPVAVGDDEATTGTYDHAAFLAAAAPQPAEDDFGTAHAATKAYDRSALLAAANAGLQAVEGAGVALRPAGVAASSQPSATREAEKVLVDMAAELGLGAPPAGPSEFAPTSIVDDSPPMIGLGAREGPATASMRVAGGPATSASREANAPETWGRKSARICVRVVLSLLLLASIGAGTAVYLVGGRLDRRLLQLDKDFWTGLVAPRERAALGDVQLTEKRSVLYPSRAGAWFLVLFGEATNTGAGSADYLDVVAELRDAAGQVVTSGRAPLGVSLSPSEIVDITGAESLLALYRAKLTARPEATKMAGKASTGFVIVVPNPLPHAGDLEHVFKLEPAQEWLPAPPAPSPEVGPPASNAADLDKRAKAKAKAKTKRKEAPAGNPL